jgi:gliding motility-associated-like protein
MGTTTYTVTVTNEAGCTGTASITVTVFEPFCDERDIFFPNAFTPNNDGKNDVLLLRSNFVTDLDLHIYNRWGEEVFKSNNINVGWDGTYNGKVLPPDVFGYYFTATCPNAKTYSKQGNVTLLH